MDLAKRRGFLENVANPRGGIDYVVELKGAIESTEEGAGGRRSAELSVRYVPDKWILDPGAFGRYLEALATIEFQSLEALAAAILDDIANEAVVRWVQVVVTAPDTSHSPVDRHGVMLEDRQPRWDNPSLLSRMKRF